jgi:GNAT superfamily N-acetyltransferase
MSIDLIVRPIAPDDYAQWRPLWDGYNAFYGRSGETALDEPVTATTWQRFLDSSEPMFAIAAQSADQLVGIAHYLLHRNTTKIELVCYLQDLFTAPHRRGEGIGRALIEAVCADARRRGLARVYWHTHTTNEAGRALYDTLARHPGFIVYTRDPI